MEKPRNISSGEAMRWNEDVECRRREYHAMRCSEDPIYRRAYERQQKTMMRLQKQCSEALTQIATVLDNEARLSCQKDPDQIEETNNPVEVKNHEQQEAARQLLADVAKYGREGIPGNGLAAAFLIGLMFANGDKLKQQMKELEEEKPYAQEIRKTDEAFDKEIIRMSGFAW